MAVSAYGLLDLVLEDFSADHAETVVGWARSADEALRWAEVPFLRLAPDVLELWHAQPSVVPCVGLLGERLCAYGLIVEEPAARAAEVSRVIVAPELRGQGIGPAFASLLAAEARRRGLASVFARTLRANRPAFDCYRDAGFVRVPREDEVALNIGKAEDYVWLELPRSSAP
jgi:ribosomal protein S18 acetylase RimI-like enzyme